MAKYKGSSYKNNTMLEITGVSELLKKIEKAKGDAVPAVAEMAKDRKSVV